ncbi:hypothetical protein B296_00048883 [Ensete ventricosum]|uniref:Uncharacterized protein n=1 Tax=Ensete ventricosum TaxID=4639 RepID=A0A426XK58_ENSVE|nr:hypothetical protein B296_00048883 [Ensete ventricosum]
MKWGPPGRRSNHAGPEGGLASEGAFPVSGHWRETRPWMGVRGEDEERWGPLKGVDEFSRTYMDEGGTTRGRGLTLNTSPSLFLSPPLDHGGDPRRPQPMESDRYRHRSGENLPVVNEMDFFSDERWKAVSKVEPDLDLKTGLNLLTANAGSDQSTVDDGMSPADDSKENKSEAADEKAQAKNHERGGVLVPRQFMDLGPAAEADEPSHSSTASRDRPSSPPDNVEVGSKDRQLRKQIARPDRPKSSREDSPGQDWNPSKDPKLSPSKSTEQVQEAIMRKARVSVRARSEAPMVIETTPNPQLLFPVHAHE